jgi:hypothetical protein
MLKRIGMVDLAMVPGFLENAPPPEASTVAGKTPARAPERAPATVTPPRTKRLKADELVEWDEYCMFSARRIPLLQSVQAVPAPINAGAGTS